MRPSEAIQRNLPDEIKPIGDVDDYKDAVYLAAIQLRHACLSVILARTHFKNNYIASPGNPSPMLNRLASKFPDSLNLPADENDTLLITKLAIDITYSNADDLVKTVELLIEHGASLTQTRDGKNLLQLAFEKNRPAGVLIALAKSKTLDASFILANGDSPLKFGIDQNSPEALAGMLAKNANPNGEMTNSTGKKVSALEYAIEQYCQKKCGLFVIQTLLDYKPTISLELAKAIIDLDILDLSSAVIPTINIAQHGTQLLQHTFARETKSQDDVAAELIKKGTPTKVVVNGATKEFAFDAVAKELPKTLQAILDARKEEKTFINEIFDDHGNSLIVNATEKGNIQIFKMLREAGADIAAATNAVTNERLLHIAIRKKSVALVRETAIKALANLPNSDKDHPLIQAAKNNSSDEIFKLLIDAGANVKTLGKNAFLICLETNNVAAALYLFQTLCEKQLIEKQDIVTYVQKLNSILAPYEQYKIGNALSQLPEYDTDNENLQTFYATQKTLAAEESNSFEIIATLNVLTKHETSWIKEWASHKLKQLIAEDVLFSAAIRFNQIAQEQLSPLEQKEAKHAAQANEDEQIAALKNNRIKFKTIEYLNNLCSQGSQQAKKELARLLKTSHPLIQAKIASLNKSSSRIQLKMGLNPFQPLPNSQTLCTRIANNNYESVLYKIIDIYLLQQAGVTHWELDEQLNELATHQESLVQAAAKLALNQQLEDDKPATIAAKILLKVIIKPNETLQVELFKLADNLKLLKHHNLTANELVEWLAGTCERQNPFVSILLFEAFLLIKPENLRSYNLSGHYDPYLSALGTLDCHFNWEKDILSAMEFLEKVASSHRFMYVRHLANLRLVECYRLLNLPHLDEKAIEVLKKIETALAEDNSEEANYLRKKIQSARLWQRSADLPPEQKEQKEGEAISPDSYLLGKHNNSGIPDIVGAAIAYERDIVNAINKSDRHEAGRLIMEFARSYFLSLSSPEMRKEVNTHISDYKQRLVLLDYKELEDKGEFDKLFTKLKAGETKTKPYLERVALGIPDLKIKLAAYYWELANAAINSPNYDALAEHAVFYTCDFFNTMKWHYQNDWLRNDIYKKFEPFLKKHATQKKPIDNPKPHFIKAAQEYAKYKLFGFDEKAKSLADKNYFQQLILDIKPALEQKDFSHQSLADICLMIERTNALIPLCENYLSLWENYLSGKPSEKSPWLNAWQNSYINQLIGGRGLLATSVEEIRSILQKLISLRDALDRNLVPEETNDHPEAAAAAANSQAVADGGAAQNLSRIHGSPIGYNGPQASAPPPHPAAAQATAAPQLAATDLALATAPLAPGGPQIPMPSFP